VVDVKLAKLQQISNASMDCELVFKVGGIDVFIGATTL
jgi:hypothetical protein